MFTASGVRIGELLVQRGLITAQQLNDALEEQKQTGRFFGLTLVSRGWASEEAVARTLSEQVGLAFVDLSTHTIDPEVLKLIPASLCSAHQALPLYGMGESLTIAMANPLDTTAIEELQRASKRHIWPVFAAPSAIRNCLEGSGVAANQPSEQASTAAQAVPRPHAAAGPTNMTQIVQVVNTLIGEAIGSGASDIHLEPSKGRFICRYRTDGILQNRPDLPDESQAAIISRIKVMANMDIAERRLPQDGRIQMEIGGRPVDLRVSTFPTIHGENVVIRILDKKRAMLTLEDLGFAEGTFKHYTAVIAKPYGIMLVTGPTGSGKTTTLYATLNRLNDQEKNIMTLEDPVEYELAGIRQSQVNIKAGLSFATGLRSMVRQDPDIILIGEIRDKETADIAIHASLTGHLVFSTLHTNDASSAASRLTDMGVEPFLVATSLVGILAQRLVRVLCEGCKTPYAPAAELLSRLGISASHGLTLYEPKGCARCRQTGYQGRLGVYELLLPNEQIRSLITQKSAAGLIRDEAIRGGMTTLRQDSLEKLIKGTTSVAEILRVTSEE
jgi:type IV pilus assembly protein PilB